MSVRCWGWKVKDQSACWHQYKLCPLIPLIIRGILADLMQSNQVMVTPWILNTVLWDSSLVTAQSPHDICFNKQQKGERKIAELSSFWNLNSDFCKNGGSASYTPTAEESSEVCISAYTDLEVRSTGNCRVGWFKHSVFYLVVRKHQHTYICEIRYRAWSAITKRGIRSHLGNRVY